MNKSQQSTQKAVSQAQPAGMSWVREWTQGVTPPNNNNQEWNTNTTTQQGAFSKDTVDPEYMQRKTIKLQLNMVIFLGHFNI